MRAAKNVAQQMALLFKSEIDLNSQRLMVAYVSFCYLEDLVLLALVHLSCQAAVSQSVLDDVFVRLGAGLLVQLWP